MDTNQMVGTMIGAGIGLAIIDRIGNGRRPKRKSKSVKVKRLSER